MLSYLYVLKVCAVCGLAPLAFQSVTAVGWLLEGRCPPYLQSAFSRLYVNKILLVDIYLYNIVVYLTFRV